MSVQLLLFLSFKRNVHRRQVPGPEKREAKKCYPSALPLDPGGARSLSGIHLVWQTLWSQLHEAAGEGASSVLSAEARQSSARPSPLCLLFPEAPPFTVLRARLGRLRSVCPGHCYPAPDHRGFEAGVLCSDSSLASPGPRPSPDRGPGGFADRPTGLGSYFPDPCW